MRVNQHIVLVTTGLLLRLRLRLHAFLGAGVSRFIVTAFVFIVGGLLFVFLLLRLRSIPNYF